MEEHKKQDTTIISVITILAIALVLALFSRSVDAAELSDMNEHDTVLSKHIVNEVRASKGNSSFVAGDEVFNHKVMR